MLRAIIDLDHLPYLASFLAGLAVALAFGAYLFARGRARLPIERLSLLLCPAVVFITLTLATSKVVQAPDNDWNGAGLAPAVGLLSGAKLYVGPGGPGAVMNATHPPLAYLVYVPAGLFSRATYAILAGSCISFALYLAPAVVLSFSPRKDGAGGRPVLMSVAALLVFSQAALISKSLGHAAFFIHADAPMLAFAGIASLALYLRRGDATLSLPTCLTSAAFAAMAVGSELTAAPLILVLPIWVLATRGFRESLRYTLCLLVALASFTLLFRTVFGVDSFTFNIIKIPSRRPWIYQGPELTNGILMLATEYFCVSIAFFASILLAALARRSFTPEDATSSESGANGLRRLLVENPWLLFVLMAVAAVPSSFLSRLEVGSYLNNYAPTPYFLVLGLIALLFEWHAVNHRRGLEPFNAVLTLTLLLLVLSPLTVCEDNFQGIDSVHRPSKNVQEAAYRYSKRHPGTAYFPWNPLSTLLAEGKAYHFEYGLVDRELAGYPVSQEHFRRNIPANIRYVCFPGGYKFFGKAFEKTMTYLPEFGRRVEIQELPGWTCYER